MITTTKRARLFVLVLGLAGLAPAAGSAQPVEWTLKVAVDGARVHWSPETASPAVAVAARGTVLKSCARQGAWFRVLVEPGRGGFVVLGYIAGRDVEVADEAGPPRDIWKQVAGEFRGAGLSLRVGGGIVFFGGGDFETGFAGLYDRTSDLAASYGAVMQDFDKKPIGAGLRLSGDFVYRLTRRLGCGLRFEYWKAAPDSFIRVHYGDVTQTYTAWSSADTSVIALGAGLYYDHPLGHAWTLAFQGGPALHFVDFQYARKLVFPAGEDIVSIGGRAHGFGLQGGLGLEWRFLRRLALFVEAQGRVANIGGFEGDESHYWSLDFQSWRSKTSGRLYLEEGEGPPRLVVLGEGTAGEGDRRRAEMNLGGAGIAAGFRVRF